MMEGWGIKDPAYAPGGQDGGYLVDGELPGGLRVVGRPSEETEERGEGAHGPDRREVRTAGGAGGCRNSFEIRGFDTLVLFWYHQ